MVTRVRGPSSGTPRRPAAGSREERRAAGDDREGSDQDRRRKRRGCWLIASRSAPALRRAGWGLGRPMADLFFCEIEAAGSESRPPDHSQFYRFSRGGVPRHRGAPVNKMKRRSRPARNLLFRLSLRPSPFIYVPAFIVVGDRPLVCYRDACCNRQGNNHYPNKSSHGSTPVFVAGDNEEGTTRPDHYSNA